MASIATAFAQVKDCFTTYVPDTLILQACQDVVHEWRERQLWQMTLVRMGLPIDQMPYPDNFTPEERAKERTETLEAVRKYDPDQRDGYNY